MNLKGLGRLRLEDLRDKAIRAYFGLIIGGLVVLAMLGLAFGMYRSYAAPNQPPRPAAGWGVAIVALMWIFKVWSRNGQLARKRSSPPRVRVPVAHASPQLSITDFEPPDPEDWASGPIEFDRGIDVTDRWIWTLVALAVCGLFGYSTLSLPGTTAGSSRAELAFQVALLALPPMACLIWAIVGTRAARKFGVSTFQLTSGPGRIGRQLEGLIDLAASARPQTGLKIELLALRQDAEGDCVVERTLVPRGTPGTRVNSRHRGRLEIPVSIAIPSDAQPTMRAKSGECVRWILVVRATQSGYQAEFEVPVLEPGKEGDLRENVVSPRAQPL